MSLLPEGTKDELCHKFRRLTIGQNYSAVCTNDDAIENNQWTLDNITALWVIVLRTGIEHGPLEALLLLDTKH